MIKVLTSWKVFEVLSGPDNSVFWWSRNCWGQQKSGREEQDSEQQGGKERENLKENKWIERGRKKCHENEHWSKRSYWKIMRTELISRKAMSSPRRARQGVLIKGQPGSRAGGRGGLGQSGEAAIPPARRAGCAGAVDVLHPPPNKSSAICWAFREPLS